MVNIGMDLNQPTNDSVPTDNPSGDQKSFKVPVMECQHFSIRRYVADIRKRNPKLCDPFSLLVSRDGSMDIKHELPPMELPNFRWPQCDSRTPGPGSSCGTSKEAQKSTAEVADAPMPLIEVPSKVVEAPKDRSTEASTSTDSNDNKNCNPSTIFADKKGKGKAHIEDELAPKTGFENGPLKESSSQGILQQTTDGKEASRSADDEVVVRARSVEDRKTTKSHNHKNRKSAEIVIGSHRERVNREKGNNVNEVSLMHQQASLEAQCAGALTNGVRTEVAGIFHGSGSGSSSGSKARVVPLPDLNEFNVQPSEDDDNKALFTGNNNLVEDDDDYLGADHRKTPKVRLLSELLGLKENPNDAKLKKKIPSSSSFPGPSGSKSTSSDPQAQSLVNESGKRKRVSSDRDEDSKSLEIKGSNNGTKKLRTPRHVETSESDSESEDEFTEIISEAFAKRRSRSSLGKNPLLEKNHKKVKFDHGATSSMSRQKIIPKSSSHEKGKSSDKRVPADAITVEPRVIDLPRKIDAAHDLNDRNVVLMPKKKGKVVQGGKEQTLNTLLPCKNYVPRECSPTVKEKEAMQKTTEHFRDQPSQDGSAGKGSYHFSYSYMDARNDQINIQPVKDGFYVPPPSSGIVIHDGGIQRRHTEKRNMGEASFALRTTSGAAHSTGSRCDENRERSTVPKSNSKGKRVWIPEAEVGGAQSQHSVMQVSNAIMNQKELANDVRGRIQDIDINSIPTDDKIPEQDTAGDDSHDIPMDIVELMAKNQYERNLSEPQDTHHPISLPNYGRNVTFPNGESMQQGRLIHILSSQKPQQAGDTRNAVVSPFEEMVAKQRMLGPFSDFNQNHYSIRGRAQGQERISPYSTVALAPNNNNWNGHVDIRSYFPSYLQAMDSYNRHRGCSPRPNMDPRAWPSMVGPSRMPMGITNPEMMSQSPSVLNKGTRFHHQGPAMLNFNHGKTKNLSFSNGAYNAGPVDKSVDLYSKEAVSAMHLLSLMQNAAAKRPPVHPDHPPRKPYYFEPGSQNTRSSSSSRPSLIENSGHPCYPVLPPARTFAPSFQMDVNCGRNNSGFISPIPLTSRGQRNMEGSHFVTAVGENRKRPLASFLDKGKGIEVPGMSSPSSFAANPNAKELEQNYPYGAGTGRPKTVLPTPKTDVCTVNRNPSELNDPKELSRYMIGSEELRRPSRSVCRGRSRGDGIKRQEMRMNKPFAGVKDRERERKS